VDVSVQMCGQVGCVDVSGHGCVRLDVNVSGHVSVGHGCVGLDVNVSGWTWMCQVGRECVRLDMDVSGWT
jgi:hypothetical protein